ncbi:MAG: MFS transporter [Anaerolineae bacterium]
MSDYERTIRANFRRNFMVNIADFSLWSVGLALISTSTVLPLYLRHLTDSPLIIALVPSIQFLGWRLPQLFTANLVQNLPRKKPFVVWMALNERIPFALLGLFILLATDVPNTIALAVALVLLTWQALGGGIIANPWQEMVAKICLPTHWGLFFGVSNAMGALLAVGGAALSRQIFARFAYPHSYAYSYIFASVFMMASWASLAFLVEPAKAPTRAPVPYGQFLRRLPAILRQDANFRSYIFVRSVAVFGSMGSGFLAVHAAERFGLGDEAAATFTGVIMVTTAVLNPLLGRLGDRRGHKSVLTVSFWTQTGSMLVAALAPNPTLFLIAFALKGASDAAFMSSGTPIVFEFCDNEDRPTYIGLGNTLTAPPVILAPVAAGLLATAVGYGPVFWVSALISLLSTFAWTRWVRDPRPPATATAIVDYAAPPSAAA